MASVDELSAALTDALESNGDLERIRAHVRSSIFSVLEDSKDTTDAQSEGIANRAKNASEETLTERGAAHASYAINELFLEYLQFSGMNHTASVFLRESGHSRRSGDGKDELAKRREFLRRVFGIDDESETTSLTVRLLSACRGDAHVHSLRSLVFSGTAGGLRTGGVDMNAYIGDRSSIRSDACARTDWDTKCPI